MFRTFGITFLLCAATAGGGIGLSIAHSSAQAISPFAHPRNDVLKPVPQVYVAPVAPQLASLPVPKIESVEPSASLVLAPDVETPARFDADIYSAFGPQFELAPGSAARPQARPAGQAEITPLPLPTPLVIARAPAPQPTPRRQERVATSVDLAPQPLTPPVLSRPLRRSPEPPYFIGVFR